MKNKYIKTCTAHSPTVSCKCLRENFQKNKLEKRDWNWFEIRFGKLEKMNFKLNWFLENGNLTWKLSVLWKLKPGFWKKDPGILKNWFLKTMENFNSKLNWFLKAEPWIENLRILGKYRKLDFKTMIFHKKGIWAWPEKTTQFFFVCRLERLFETATTDWKFTAFWKPGLKLGFVITEYLNRLRFHGKQFRFDLISKLENRFWNLNCRKLIFSLQKRFRENFVNCGLNLIWPENQFQWQKPDNGKFIKTSFKPELNGLN